MFLGISMELKNEVISKLKMVLTLLLILITRNKTNWEIFTKDIVKVFILPPSIEELENRLGKRASENKENFIKRMSEAKEEISHFNEYDFLIVNDEIQKAVSQIKSIIFSERLRRYRQLKLKKIVKKLI